MSTEKNNKRVCLRGKKPAIVRAKAAVHSILDRQEQLENDLGHIKAMKGTNYYLAHIGSLQGVNYPHYWNCVSVDRAKTMLGSSREQLTSGSKEFNDVLKIVMGTWDAKRIGQGHDAKGLSHRNIAVRNVYRIENPRQFNRYDTVKKNFCLQASANAVPAIDGLQGQRDVNTHKLGQFVCIWIF